MQWKRVLEGMTLLPLAHKRIRKNKFLRKFEMICKFEKRNLFQRALVFFVI